MDELIQKHELEEVAKQAVEVAREHFIAFCMLMNPYFVMAPHLWLIHEKLTEVLEGRTQRLMIFMPPRSGKSFMTSQYFPSFALGHHPSWQLVTISHSAELAEDFSREVRNMIATEAYQHTFPGIMLRQDSRAANRWHTANHGTFVAMGVGGKLAGRGANVAFIDDPISEQDAYSKAKREQVNRWYPSGLRSRLMPNGRIVLTMTRWNEADIAGVLMKKAEVEEDSDQWEILRIPALLDEEAWIDLSGARDRAIEAGVLPEYYPELRVGETYWPVLSEYAERDYGLRGWHTEELLKTKANSPPHEWEALYMQRPTAEEGNILKRSWWGKWDKPTPPKIEYRLLSLDTAYSSKEDADFSAWIDWGIFRDEEGVPNMIMLGAGRGRWEYPKLRRICLELYNDLSPDVLLIEKKSSGQSLIQDLMRAGIPIFPYDPRDRDKIARVHATSAIFYGGRIHAPIGKHWADEVIYECSVFPSGQSDDYVDCTTQAVLWMQAGSWIVHPDDMWLYEDDNQGKLAGGRRLYW